MFRLVIDTGQQRILYRQGTLFTQPANVAFTRLKNDCKRIFLVDGHQLVAQLIIGSVQGQGEGNVNFLAKAINHRCHTCCGQCYLALGNTVPQVIQHDVHGGNHIVEVEQRLPHAHHHHVGDGPVHPGRNGAKRLVGDPDLADDLRCRQVTVEALLAGRTKAAVQRTASLRGNTEGTTAFLRDVYSLYTAAASHPNHTLAGPVGRNIFTDHFRTTNVRCLVQLRAQCLADVGHVGKVIHAEVVNPLHHLPGTEALLAQLLEESFHLRQGQAQQVNLFG